MYSHSRHIHIFDAFKHDTPVLIAGCGAVGSHIAMQLISLGCSHVTVVDFDRVEPHNLPNQIFGQAHIGMPKVDALEQIAKDKMGDLFEQTCHYTGIVGRMPCHTMTHLKATALGKTPVLILAVDTMQARKEIVDYLVDRQENWHVIETRMASSYGNVYSFPISKAQVWQGSLIPDSEGELSPCGTSISVLPTVQFISSLAVWEFIKLQTDPNTCREATNVFLKPSILTTNSL